METIYQIFASLDIFSILINIFPEIFNPIADGFKSILVQVYSSFESIIALHPAIIFSVLIFLSTWGLFSFFQWIFKSGFLVVKK
jgi:hypothetical protein